MHVRSLRAAPSGRRHPDVISSRAGAAATAGAALKRPPGGIHRPGNEAFLAAGWLSSGRVTTVQHSQYTAADLRVTVSGAARDGSCGVPPHLDTASDCLF